MKKFLLLTVFISINLFAQYTTPGNGINWNLDSLVLYSGGVVTGSYPDYTVSNKIFISVNDLVWITPGSTLQFTNAASGFEVNGIFKSAGTADSIITFTSPTEDSLGFYDGLRFNENVLSSTSLISYTYIEYSKFGMRCVDASPVMTNSHIYKCGRGVQLSGSDSEISFNKIERCYEYGILINLDSNPLIEGNEISFNNTQGTSAKNQISTGLQGNNSPSIKNNMIYGGESIPTGGISLWVSGAANFSNMIVEGNTIFNNSFGVTLLSSSNGIINALIKNNVIYNNNINPDALVSGSGININGSPFNQPVITGNEIYDNWWGLTIQNGTTVQAGPQPNIGNTENSATDDDGLNIIYGNIQGTDTFDLYNNCTNNIYAQNNDWRVYDSLSIEQHIFHKADDTTHGLVKFIPFSNFIPVELVSFTADINGSDVILEWQTASERNNKGFEIERSQVINGYSQMWEKIGFVSGKGTATEQQTYSFVDNSSEAGKQEYRLKQIDFDGMFKYSNIVEINLALPEEFLLQQNYPNPFNPITMISWHLSSSSHVSIKVFDVLGNEVATLINEESPAGNYRIKFNAEKLSSGVYIYQLKAGNSVLTRKMLLMK